MRAITPGEGIILVGVLATAELRAVLGIGAGMAERLGGSLRGGGRAGLIPGGWPRLLPGAGSAPALRVTATEALARYAGAIGLRPVPTAAGDALGLGAGEGPEGEPDPYAAAAAEAVRNSNRHAHSTTPTTVTVSLDSPKLTVVVADDGRGFDPQTVPADRLGITVSIRDRMAAIGGSADIDSAPGRGTRVSLRWVQQ